MKSVGNMKLQYEISRVHDTIVNGLNGQSGTNICNLNSFPLSYHLLQVINLVDRAQCKYNDCFNKKLFDCCIRVY